MNKHSTVLRHEREQRGWSQKDLADHIGSNRVTVSRWEQGITVPDYYFQERLCKLFKKSREELGFVAPAEIDDSNTPTSIFLDPMLPIPSPYFVGREAELEDLKRQTATPRSMGSITWLAGCGQDNIGCGTGT